MSKTKHAFILQAFNDAGTGESFAAGSVPPISEGAFINYSAANLVREATEAEIKAAEAKAAKADAKPDAESKVTDAKPNKGDTKADA